MISRYIKGNSTSVRMREPYCNPRRACAASGLSVCVGVSTLILHGTTSYEATYEYIQIYDGLHTKQAILLKRLRSGDMA